jgi:serine/threonine protein kinase
LSYSYRENAIVMEAGISILQFVGRSLVYPFFIESILKQLNYIQIILKQCRIAHCDIKPDNLIITYNHDEGLRVKLIDNELAVSFGLCRLVATP